MSADTDSAAVAATAFGPDGPIQLKQTPHPFSFAAPLTTAGTYSLTVTLTDTHTGLTVPLPARKQLVSVRVVPGPVCAQRTAIQAMPQKLVAGVGAEFRICPVDAFGNAGASGAGLTTMTMATYLMCAGSELCVNCCIAHFTS